MSSDFSRLEVRGWKQVDLVRHLVSINMFALTPETKKKVFAEELVTIDHAKLTNMEEIGE